MSDDPYDIDGDGTMNEAETNSKITIELAFKKFDEDNSGFIDAIELNNLIESLDADGDMTPEDQEKALKELDSDGSGRIEKSEFIQWWLDLNGTGDDDSVLRKRLRNLAKQGRKRLGTDIHKAAWEGNLDVVQAFVTTRSSLVNEDDDTDHGDKYRPLHYAAYQGHEDVCKYLMSKGAKINEQTTTGCTALFFASQQGREDIVRLLLSHRASAAIVETECGLGPVDVADTDEIRALFKTIGKYQRPNAPLDVTAKVVVSKKKKSQQNQNQQQNKKNGNKVLVEVNWIHDVNGGERKRGSSDENLPVSGFLVKMIDEETDEELRIIDVPKVFNEDGDNDETTHRCRIRVDAGTCYIFRVAAVNGLGRSKYSRSSLDIMVGDRPNRPTHQLELSASQPTSATVQWDTSNDATNTGGQDGDAGTVTYVIEQQRIGDSDAWMERDRGTGTSNNLPRPVDNKFKTAKKDIQAGKFTTEVTLDRLTTGSIYQIRLYMTNSSGSGSAGDILKFETPMFEKKRNRSGRKTTKSYLGKESLKEGTFDENDRVENEEDEQFKVHHVDE